MSRHILITGASSGIGQSLAYLCANHFSRIYICARRKDRLLDLKNQIEKQHSCEIIPLVFDVRKEEEVNMAISALNRLDVLVNNAGLALGRNSIERGKTEHWNTMLDTNVKGLLYVSKACIPLLKKSEHAHIVNISSIAGKETYLFGNTYCASKHAVDSLSKAMRMELLADEIKVSNICPGAVNTEFSLVRYEGDQKKADETYNGYTELSPADVAESILHCLRTPKHVNINDLVIMPRAQANATLFHKD